MVPIFYHMICRKVKNKNSPETKVFILILINKEKVEKCNILYYNLNKIVIGFAAILRICCVYTDATARRALQIENEMIRER